MKAVPWQGGMLVAWVQGAFGIGGDTVRCQYAAAAGAPQWAQPTVVAARELAAGVIYESQDGLNVLPTDSGAAITHALAVGGGGDRLTFNRVNFAGKRRYANNWFQLALPYYLLRHCRSSMARKTRSSRGVSACAMPGKGVSIVEYTDYP